MSENIRIRIPWQQKAYTVVFNKDIVVFWHMLDEPIHNVRFVAGCGLNASPMSSSVLDFTQI